MSDQSNDSITDIIKNYLQTEGFSDRKITDTPTDGLMVVNRNYVTLNGSTTNRPKGSVIGQFYFDTTLGYPIWKNANTNWTNSVGSVVG